MLEMERLEANLTAIQELQDAPSDDAKLVLFEYVLPMMKELMEAQIAELEAFDDGESDDDAQVVALNVSTFSELQAFLRMLFVEPSHERRVRNLALQLFAQIHAEVDGKPVQQVLHEVQEAMQSSLEAASVELATQPAESRNASESEVSE